jgi:hypothetical protein
MVIVITRSLGCRLALEGISKISRAVVVTALHNHWKDQA